MLEQVEQKTLERQQEEKKKNDGGWLSYIFGGGKEIEEKKKSEKDEDLENLYKVIAENVQPQKETEMEDNALPQARPDEYNWLVGEFTLGKGELKIQRETTKQNNSIFKEVIVFSLGRIQAKFNKRFKGMDVEAKMGTVILETYSSFDKKNRINNIILERNKNAQDFIEDGNLATINMRFMPPNTDMHFEMDITAKSLRIYYLPLLMSRLIMFLGEQEVRSTTINALADIKDNTQDTIQAALEGKKSKISVSIESPILIVPIFKNNDPTSPVWRFRLGDITIKSKVALNIKINSPM